MAFEAMKKVMRKLAEGAKEKEIDDDETKDKYLRSLRRERRIQMEEVEKERLKKTITKYKHAQRRRHLWGVKKAAINRAKRKKAKVHKNMLRNNSTWVGRGNV